MTGRARCTPTNFHVPHRITRPVPEDSEVNDAYDGSSDDLGLENHRFRWCVYSLPPKAEKEFNAFMGPRAFGVIWLLQLATRTMELCGVGSTGVDGFPAKMWTAFLVGVTASTAIAGSPVKSAMLDHPFAFFSGTTYVNHIVRCVGIASSQFDTARVQAFVDTRSFLFFVPLLNGLLTPLLGGGLSGQLFALGTVAMVPLVTWSVGIRLALAPALATWAASMALGNFTVILALRPLWASAARSGKQERRLRRRLRALERYSELDFGVSSRPTLRR